MASQKDQYNRGLANGPIDRQLLRAASEGLSPQEMSRVVKGLLSPEQAAQRVRDLLESRNWLTYFEQEQLILESINDILGGLREWVDAGSVQHVNAALKALKMKQDQHARNRISPEEAGNIIREGQARIMLTAIQALVSIASEELARRHDVQLDEVHEVFLLKLPAAVEAVEARIEQQ